MVNPSDHLNGDLLCEYAEGGLEAAAKAAADRHLQACESCRRELRNVQSYFTDMQGLEAIPAPADFLAKVRARVEQPAPLKKFWSRLTNPWRLIPAQLALLTLLGVTISIVYLHQKDGLSNAEISKPEPSHSSDALSKPLEPSEPSASKEEEAPMLADKVASRPRLNAEARSAEKKSIAGSSSSTKSESESEFGSESGSRSGSGLGSGSKMERAVGSLENDQPLAKLEAPAVQAAPMAPSKSKMADDYSGEEMAGKNVTGKTSERVAEKDVAITLEYSLRLTAEKDSTALWTGLKAMGAEVSRDVNRNSPQGADYLVLLPASLQKDFRVYLEHYGKVENGKSVQHSAGASQIRIRLNLLSP